MSFVLSQHPVLQLEFVSGITEMEMEERKEKREKGGEGREGRQGEKKGVVEKARTGRWKKRESDCVGEPDAGNSWETMTNKSSEVRKERQAVCGGQLLL